MLSSTANTPRRSSSSESLDCICRICCMHGMPFLNVTLRAPTQTHTGWRKYRRKRLKQALPMMMRVQRQTRLLHSFGRPRFDLL